MTAQEFFKNDLFAENAGVVLLEVRKGYSKAKLEIKPEHLNAGARTQGGAIFTLADLALAAAANSHGTLDRPKHRLLSGRYNKPRRRADCNF